MQGYRWLGTLLDFRSAFNTIIPDIQVSKLTALGLHPVTWSWINDFFTNRPQIIKLNSNDFLSEVVVSIHMYFSC